MMSDKFVVSTNDVGEIIVTDVETGNVYHYGSMSNFLGLIRLLNEQDRKIRQLEKSIERREEQISIIKKHCLKFLTDEQFETIRKALEDD
jgi:predicted DNA binding protein